MTESEFGPFGDRPSWLAADSSPPEEGASYRGPSNALAAGLTIIGLDVFFFIVYIWNWAMRDLTEKMNIAAGITMAIALLIASIFLGFSPEYKAWAREDDAPPQKKLVTRDLDRIEVRQAKLFAVPSTELWARRPGGKWMPDSIWMSWDDDELAFFEWRSYQ